MAGEIIVIGAGPAGLSVMAEAGYHEAGRVILLEKGESHNQTVHQYYPDEKRVDAAYKGAEAVCAGVLCFRDTTKANFLDIAEQMVRLHPGEVHYGCHVDSVRKLPDGGFLVTSSDGREFRGSVTVIAIGRMGKPNRPDYFNQIPPTVRRLVQFDVRNLRPEGKSILVVGGGNSAIEFALSLNRRARTTVSYRGAAFNRLNAMNLSLLNEEERAGRIEVLRESHIERIADADGRPLVHFRAGEPRTFEHVIFGIGGSSPTAFLQNAGIELDERGNPRLDEWGETNVEGLYVAGELSVPQGKGSIIVSFNSGKRVVERIMAKRGQTRKPELVSMVGAR